MYREYLNISFVTSYLAFVRNCFFYQLWLCCFNNYRGRLCDMSLLHFIVSHSLCKCPSHFSHLTSQFLCHRFLSFSCSRSHVIYRTVLPDSDPVPVNQLSSECCICIKKHSPSYWQKEVICCLLYTLLLLWKFCWKKL